MNQFLCSFTLPLFTKIQILFCLQLHGASLVVTVWDHNSKSKDDFVGRIVIGHYGTGPQEAQHWQRMLQSQRSPVAQWHSLKSREDCDQVSVASIAVAWKFQQMRTGSWFSIQVFQFCVNMLLSQSNDHGSVTQTFPVCIKSCHTNNIFFSVHTMSLLWDRMKQKNKMDIHKN